MERHQIAEFEATHTVDLAWIWRVFLARTKRGTYTLSAEQESFDGAPQRISPWTGIRDAAALREAFEELWWAMFEGDFADSDIDDLMQQARTAFPSLG